MDFYVLDTNLFFNFEPGIGLSQKTEETIRLMTKIAITMQEQNKGSIILSPKIVEEILSFFDDKNQPFLKEFFSAVRIQSPDTGMVTLPTHAIGLLIEETRQRGKRGLQVAIEEIEKTAQAFTGTTQMPRPDFQKKVGEFIRTLRDRHRQATRVGFIDSLADFECILLAKQLNGTLVTTDEGLLHWAREFGVREMPAAVFGQKVRDFLPHQEQVE